MWHANNLQMNLKEDLKCTCSILSNQAQVETCYCEQWQSNNHLYLERLTFQSLRMSLVSLPLFNCGHGDKGTVCVLMCALDSVAVISFSLTLTK